MDLFGISGWKLLNATSLFKRLYHKQMNRYEPFGMQEHYALMLVLNCVILILATFTGVVNSLIFSCRNKVVIVEGNYLLLDNGVWKEISSMFDEKW